MGKTPKGHKACLLYINEKILEKVDFYRKRSIDSRTSWIVKAILDKLGALGCDTDKLFSDEEK